ncbi:hypothetical protein NBRC110019_17360 [Neptunitalea chrysea]|uniref:Tryptophan-rich sensory protein n=1 Tax=Neptunitalea chrysea TaxID=1647581 RepID=A0A9W6B4Q0_9FLAO|nr:tryptophan-rich sensory protein [Neptunitalea chrysea]GLB52696.1 hypothetical protein NBRC110019_17360 [Neptunitalea chrysea]
MAKRLAILNFLSVIVAIFIGYYTQAIHLNGNTMASLSTEYYNLFTPANYAFAIWGIIYLLLVVSSVSHLILVFGKKQEPKFLLQSGYWFLIANIANATWVIVWLYELTGISVLVILVLLFSLLKIVQKTGIAFAPKIAPNVKRIHWVTFSIYSGWVAVATIANIAAYLVKLGWNGNPLSEAQWTILMITIAYCINIIILFRRNMIGFVIVGIWSLIAIYMRHKEYEKGIAYTALVEAIILAAMIVYHRFLKQKGKLLQEKSPSI